MADMAWHRVEQLCRRWSLAGPVHVMAVGAATATGADDGWVASHSCTAHSTQQRGGGAALFHCRSPAAGLGGVRQVKAFLPASRRSCTQVHKRRQSIWPRACIRCTVAMLPAVDVCPASRRVQTLVHGSREQPAARGSLVMRPSPSSHRYRRCCQMTSPTSCILCQCHANPTAAATAAPAPTEPRRAWAGVHSSRFRP
jgi:hypothetical protein